MNPPPRPANDPPAVTSNALPRAYSQQGYEQQPYQQSPIAHGYAPYQPRTPFGYGMGMGAMGAMGMGGIGGIGGMGMPYRNTLQHPILQSTQSTFEILENIVNAFSGFAAMLESTYLATQSGFMAMISVADQMHALRAYLSQVLSAFTLWRYLKGLYIWATGGHTSTNRSIFSAAEFNNGTASQLAPKSQVSKKPLVFFLIVVFGLPYLISKLFRIAQQSATSIAAAKTIASTESSHQKEKSITQEYDFAKAMYDFHPQNPNELGVKKGELVLILESGEPGSHSPWWKGRVQNGNVGWVPSSYLEMMEKKVTLDNTPSTQIGSSGMVSAH